MTARPSSMTGFARSEGEAQGFAFAWELRSVNARGLEVRVRLPGGFEGLEPLIRARVSGVLKRGGVTASLTVAGVGGGVGVRVNDAVIDRLLEAANELKRRLPDSPPLTIEGLFGLRGVLEAGDVVPSGEAREALDAALLATLDRALALLDGNRRQEGARLAAALAQQLASIESLRAQAQALTEAQPEAIRARLLEQIGALLEGSPMLSPERLAQEAALLATKADPREELDRLRAHHQAAEALIARAGPVGRQLDFLCQELNREANTLCSKASDLALTRLGLDLKAVIDQFREQIQNLE